MLLFMENEIMRDKYNQLLQFEPTRLTMPFRKGKNGKRIAIREILLSEQNLEKVSQALVESINELILFLQGMNQPFQFFINSDGQGKATLSFAFPYYSERESSDILQSAFTGVITEQQEKGVDNYRYYGYALGIPAQINEDSKSWIRAVLRSKLEEKFEIMILCKPLQTAEIIELTENISYEYNQFAPLRKVTRTTGEQESVQISDSKSHNSNKGMVIVSESENISSTTSKGTSNSKDESSEFENSYITKYVDILSFHLKRLEQGATRGVWQTAIYIATDSREIFSYVNGALLTTMLPESYTPSFKVIEDLTVKEFYDSGTLPDRERESNLLNGFFSRATTILTSDELTHLLLLPDEEFIGYSVRKVADFNVNVDQEKGIHIGYLYSRERKLQQCFKISEEDLTMHGLVTGITGSGKTNTILSLLENLSAPFLVIEPTKREYRHLLSRNKNVRVYTVGNENISPIRLNPFYFPKGVSLLSHIDSLKAVFMSAFSMYASMPNILEQCLYSIYKKNGWSLHHSTNVYASCHEEATPYFPTLQDLYEEIDDYVTKSGYAEEQKSNIRAALLTRLKSLMVGSKGLMLNTKECLDFDELLSYPTILELEEVADDDDKALIMGLFFIRLSQALKIKNAGQIDHPLKHVTVVEEAHRLFRNEQMTNQNPETVNIRGKAVEHFCNLLSEIRSMGEGMIIVDQIPTKLAPDTIKNTNLKIVHRLVSYDDIASMCQALGLDETKEGFTISRLKKGEAIIFKAGMERASHVLIYHSKSKLTFVSDNQLETIVEKFNPFIYEKEFIHPIAEIIMEQDNFTKNRILELIQKLYRNLMFEDIFNIKEVFNLVEKNILQIVYKSGYEINKNNEEQFLTSILVQGINQFLNNYTYFSKIKKISNKIREYLLTMTQYRHYEWSINELKLINYRRSTNLYTLLAEANERLLSDEPYMSLLNESSGLDGEAILLAQKLIEDSIYNLNFAENDKKQNVYIFYEVVKEKLKKEFLKTYNSPNFKMLLKRVLLILTAKANKPHLQQMFSNLVDKGE